MRAAIAALLLSVWGLWFFWGRITVWAVSDSARAEVRDEVSSVDSPVDGQIVAVHIERGQTVKQGDVLIELETFEQEGERDALIAELEGQRKGRQELVASIERESQALAVWLEASRAGVEEARLRALQAESAANLARQNEVRKRKLHEQSLASDEELERAVSEQLQQQGEVESLRVAAERAEREQASARADRQAQIDEQRGSLNVLDSTLESLAARVDSLQQQVGRRQIKATATGTLARVAALAPGVVVEAGDELARIVPSGLISAVAFYQPAEAIGRIRPGQPARMRLEGFPSTQFGTVPVTVFQVDGEPNDDGLIRVGLDIDTTRQTGLHVQHGMVGTIEVEVDRLSPAALLMRAVGKLLDRPAQDRTDSIAKTG